jgi:hypothetical protein
MARVSLEGSSRNTRENAIQVAKLLGDKCRQPWLLVTQRGIWGGLWRSSKSWGVM